MTLIKRNKVWHYQTKINGKTFRRSTGATDRRHAQKVAKQFETEVQLRRKQPEDWLKLSQAMDREVERIEEDISSGQAKRALASFAAFLKWLGRDPDLSEINHDLLEEYQRHRLNRVSRNTVHKDLNFLLRLLHENDYFVPKPKAKRGRETEVRAFTPNELVAIFENVTDHWRPLYATLLVTGARPAELLPSNRSQHKPLLKTEVDFKKGLIQVRQAKGRCGKRPRSRPPIPVPKDVLDLLKEQIARTPEDYPFVFTPNNNCARAFDATLKRAGIEKVDPVGRKLVLHSFRHSYATLMAEQVQNNPHFLKSVLGHTKITTTDRYCQVQPQVVPIAGLQLNFAHKPERSENRGKPAKTESIQPVQTA